MKHFIEFSFLLLLFASCSTKNTTKKVTEQVNTEKIENELIIEFDKENKLSKQSIECLNQLSFSTKTTDKVSSLNRFFKKGNFFWILIEFIDENQYAEERSLFIFEKVNGLKYRLLQNQKIQLPYGECSISLEQQLIDLGDLIIVNETGYGNGYCAYLPSFYKVNGNKLHLQNTIELVTFSYPEGQDYYTESSFSYSQKDNQVIIESDSWNKFPDQEKKFKQTKSSKTFEVKGDSIILMN